jgi:hypothetical protein
MLLDALVHQRLRRLAGGDDNAGDAKLSETAQGLRQILLAADLAHQRLKALRWILEQRIKQVLRKGSLMRETITPIKWLRWRFSPGEEVNLIPSSSAARSTRARASGEMLLLLSARDTTARETPARRATSCAVTLGLRGLTGGTSRQWAWDAAALSESILGNNPCHG